MGSMAVDLATSLEISLPHAYSARSTNAVGFEVLVRPKYKCVVYTSQLLSSFPGYRASIEHFLRMFNRELAKKSTS